MVVLRMTTSKQDRCRYTWTENHTNTNRPFHQSCCYRPVWQDHDRCILHAETDEKKPVSEIKSVLAGTIIRNHNTSTYIRTDGTTKTPAELLDGAHLPKTKIGDRISFKNCFLRGAHFRKSRLVNADFREATLTKSDLSECDLTQARFSDANCKRMVARRSKFTKANLSNVQLQGGDITESLFVSVDLSGADLTEVSMQMSVLDNADLPDATIPDADLSSQTLENCDLSNSNLRGSKFNNALLNGADLSRADLTDTSLIDTHLQNANLYQADLTDATINDANMSSADLSDSTFEAADLTGSNLEKTYIDRADLFDTTLVDVKLYGSTLSNTQINEKTIKNFVADVTKESIPRCYYDPDNPRTDDADYVKAAGMYRKLEELARNNSFAKFQGQMFIRRQDMQRERYWEEGDKFRAGFAELSRILFSYGESFWRILGWSGGVVVGFALLYVLRGWADSFPEALLFSVTTFTTGGLGGFEPTGTVAQIAATTQAALGAILIATFVFVLGRRAAR